MTGWRLMRSGVLAVSLAVALTACSGGGEEPNAAEDQVSTTAAPSTTGETPTTEPGTSTDAPTTSTQDPTVVPNLVELRGDLGVDVLVLEPTSEMGSHPTLSWQSADGAVSYWLVLRDADGRPYWAWTGSETSVRVGGGDSADANQTAVLHEPMTWRVAAFDSSGSLVALSDTVSVSP